MHRFFCSLIILAMATASNSGCASDSPHMRYMNGETANVDAIYREGNEIRAMATMSARAFPTQARDAALRRIAEMTVERGYERFGVTKVSDCGTMMMNGTSVYVQCRLLARMVGADEEATPEGDRPVTYFRTTDILAGNIRPETLSTLP